MKHVFIIHGWGGSPDSDWLPWLKHELEINGYDVTVPAMPGTEAPVIAAWVGHLKELVTPGNNVYFIAHSNGCQAVMRYLESTDAKIGGAVFVAGWFNLKDLEPEEMPVAEPWINTPIDYEKVKKNIGTLKVILSDNDPYDCLEENKIKFEKLGAEIKVIHAAGHFAADDGTFELPVALDALIDIAK
jgi:predicted alpha/beta hydrolase family esterase